ncbi:MAG: glutamate dehydrogenase, partial [Gammaproteobacteria bacterium]|nr:glutamate dehydrogenase [Gammaproteobacteria bacterium]
MATHSANKTDVYLKRFIAGVEKRNPGEQEFHQAVAEVAETVFPYIADKQIYH